MKIGVIGLGAMGIGMANNIYEQGKLHAVSNQQIVKQMIM